MIYFKFKQWIFFFVQIYVFNPPQPKKNFLIHILIYQLAQILFLPFEIILGLFPRLFND